LDGIFPGSDYLGPTPLIGVPDTDPVYPLTKALWSVAPALKKARIKVYGWINPGISVSTSNKSNIPESYAIVPNRVELDQGVIRIERLPDTVQTDHIDWGFRLTPMYGIDYRRTTAQGWFSGQLLNHNYLYGFDPVEAYALLYIPHVAKGMVIKAGRYISPPDIEAQLSPDNYLYTHSLMFTVDCYTQTGINANVKLNDQWSIMAGIHAGDDIAPWNKAAHPTGMFMCDGYRRATTIRSSGASTRSTTESSKVATTTCNSSTSLGLTGLMRRAPFLRRPRPTTSISLRLWWEEP
jgi:hypothetical protein